MTPGTTSRARAVIALGGLEPIAELVWAQLQPAAAMVCANGARVTAVHVLADRVATVLFDAPDADRLVELEGALATSLRFGSGPAREMA